MRALRVAVQVILSIVVAIALMFPLGWIFGEMDWPMYHSWGLMHGAFFSAIPSLAVATYGLVGEFRWFSRVDDAFRRALALAAGMAIVALFVVAQMSEHASFWSGASLSVVAAAFAASAVLAYRATRPAVIALMIALPLLFHDSQFLMMPLGAIVSYAGFQMTRTTIPILVAAYVGAWIANAVSRRAAAG